ncbi:alpha/beta fold hydrolase, partial [Rubrivirga sp.]|uniref:alpha/beta fold hydrolase n=1 Tax=Rubrivirga sp. TaxID=1885344 RepID=UPI003C77E801
PTALDSLLARGQLPLVPTTRAELDRLFELVFVSDPDIPGPARDVLAHDYARRAPFLRDLFGRIALEADALRPVLPEIEQPTLVLWGTEDRILSPSAVPAWQSGLPDATVRVLPGVGHAPQQESPAQTAQIVADFLADR